MNPNADDEDTGGTPPPVVLPWWACKPCTEIIPCPVREYGFVPFSQYDKDFKYPLQSSRVRAPLKKLRECGVCGPDFSSDGPPPAPEVEDLYVYVQCGVDVPPNGISTVPTDSGDYVEPDWFEPDISVTLSANDPDTGPWEANWYYNGDYWMVNAFTGESPCCSGMSDVNFILDHDPGRKIVATVFFNCA